MNDDVIYDSITFSIRYIRIGEAPVTWGPFTYRPPLGDVLLAALHAKANELIAESSKKATLDELFLLAQNKPIEPSTDIG